MKLFRRRLGRLWLRMFNKLLFFLFEVTEVHTWSSHITLSLSRSFTLQISLLKINFVISIIDNFLDNEVKHFSYNLLFSPFLFFFNWLEPTLQFYNTIFLKGIIFLTQRSQLWRSHSESLHLDKFCVQPLCSAIVSRWSNINMLLNNYL